MVHLLFLAAVDKMCSKLQQTSGTVTHTLNNLFLNVLRVMLKRALCYFKQTIHGKWIGGRRANLGDEICPERDESKGNKTLTLRQQKNKNTVNLRQTV